MKSGGEIETTGNDDDDGHGGVCILTKEGLIVDKEEKLETHGELLWSYV